MLIEEYFQQVREAIEACPLAESFNLIPEKRSTYRGFIRGQINFADGSILYLREFVHVEMTINREMYSYQYMDASKNLIFRYDNVEHHKKLNLSNYPHHKHDGSEDNVISSNAPMLAEVLNEISRLLS